VSDPGADPDTDEHDFDTDTFPIVRDVRCRACDLVGMKVLADPDRDEPAGIDRAGNYRLPFKCPRCGERAHKITPPPQRDGPVQADSSTFEIIRDE
jgi:phage FluMu protein Com